MEISSTTSNGTSTGAPNRKPTYMPPTIMDMTPAAENTEDSEESEGSSPSVKAAPDTDATGQPALWVGSIPTGDMTATSHSRRTTTRTTDPNTSEDETRGAPI